MQLLQPRKENYAQTRIYSPFMRVMQNSTLTMHTKKQTILPYKFT